MKISVIIPTYNREKALINTLQCLFDQDFDDYEIIVVDQTMKHERTTLIFLKENKDKIKYIFSSIPSVTHARNLGIKKAIGEILVFIDDDITCQQDFLRAHYNTHCDGYEVVSGKIFEDGSENAPIWIRSWLKYNVLMGKKDLRTKTNSITGCNFSVRKKVAEEVGGFDEGFVKIAVREDSDFGYRCYKAKKRMVYDPKAKLFHHRQTSGGVETHINNQFFDDSFYFCEFLFVSKNFLKIFAFIYKIRLYIIAKRELYKLIHNMYKKVIK
ncbi:MAG: glycosyltransferase [Bacteroidetes bacterium]|nr:glycosyltransferase [Bacteroidota bacterium]